MVRRSARNTAVIRDCHEVHFLAAVFVLLTLGFDPSFPFASISTVGVARSLVALRVTLAPVVGFAVVAAAEPSEDSSSFDAGSGVFSLFPVSPEPEAFAASSTVFLVEILAALPLAVLLTAGAAVLLDGGFRALVIRVGSSATGASAGLSSVSSSLTFPLALRRTLAPSSFV